MRASALGEPRASAAREPGLSARAPCLPRKAATGMTAHGLFEGMSAVESAVREMIAAGVRVVLQLTWE